jgi:tetratricopeptide (TPR) repeat protein
MESMRGLGALALARRGEFDRARQLLRAIATEKVAELAPAVLPVECELIWMERDWQRIQSVLEDARTASATGQLLALPAFANRLEGRWHAAEGRPQDAAAALQRAHDRFEQIEARWELACTDLDLSLTLLESGQAERARDLLDSAAKVFEEVSSRRELTAARELLSSAAS